MDGSAKHDLASELGIGQFHFIKPRWQFIVKAVQRLFSGRRHVGPVTPQAAAGTDAKRWSAAAKRDA
jgi:hypothetical protein